jgi:hypothetical protein
MNPMHGIHNIKIISNILHYFGFSLQLVAALLLFKPCGYSPFTLMLLYLEVR